MLLSRLVDLGLTVQRARTAGDVMRAACQALSGLEYQCFISQHIDGRLVVRLVCDSGPPIPVEASLPGFPLPVVTTQWVGADSGARCYLPPSLATSASAVIGPIESAERAWGIFGVAHAELTPDDVGPLQVFGRQLSLAIEAANTLEQLERRTVERDLVDMLTRAAPSLQLDEVLQPALALVRRMTQADAAVLHRLDASGLFQMVGEPSGYRGPLVEAFRQFNRGDTSIGKTPIAHSVRELSPRTAGVLSTMGFTQFGLVPLVLGDTCIGLLSLGRQADVSFQRDELDSAEVLGVHLAAQLERARMAAETTRLYTDLKTSYDQLAQTQAELVKHERLAALGELAAVMAHEVRNPLGVIFNSLATLRRLTTLSPDAEVLLTMVGEEADRLNRIVADLLDFARPYELTKKPLEVCALIAGAASAATKALSASHVTMRLPAAGSCPPLVADGQLLRQALVNLVVNAIQAMPRGGTLVVEARVEGDWYVLDVRDEGSGLSTQASERLFQPFFTTKATGTGLGLAVVKRIVDAHHGDISALSHHPGTTFRVRLPNVDVS